ncbi:MAG: hypothetical protein KatS3mg056_2062 [Chloroflexus sp.]|nr:MAG: hypothetical protein KatS3mg056_2062 [Chloroflexus sp.]
MIPSAGGRRTPAPSGGGLGWGRYKDSKQDSGKWPLVPLGARASGAPTTRPTPMTPAPSGGGLGWGCVSNPAGEGRQACSILVVAHCNSGPPPGLPPLGGGDKSVSPLGGGDKSVSPLGGGDKSVSPLGGRRGSIPAPSGGGVGWGCVSPLSRALRGRGAGGEGVICFELLTLQPTVG